ncbi:MAG: polysaccharide biosynthesis/export family protein [Acidobacteria bacterium]|nr:polysaccharide biosynthesis/export family protein [Acidobacteriota bacterium]
MAAERFATLGPGDQLRVDVVDLPELQGRDAKIGVDGSLSLPHVGSLRAEGLTTAALEKAIEKRLSDFMYEPHASVTVMEQASRPVYVLGSVHQPGALQMRGRLRLLEALSLAGGLSDDSGHSLTVTRRIERGPLPLPSARTDAEGENSIVEIPLQPLVTSRAPETNLELMPEDIVSVRKADLVYVVGHVEKAGGFVLKEHETVTALKALALAGGLKPHASPKRAKILRREAGASNAEAEERPVDLKAILDGRIADVPLSPEDVLFVPKSGPKTASAKAADTILSTVSGILIWRR